MTGEILKDTFVKISHDVFKSNLFSAAYKDLMFFKVRTINACGVEGPWSTDPVIFQLIVAEGKGNVWKNYSHYYEQIKKRACN